MSDDWISRLVGLLGGLTGIYVYLALTHRSHDFGVAGVLVYCAFFLLFTSLRQLCRARTKRSDPDP